MYAQLKCLENCNKLYYNCNCFCNKIYYNNSNICNNIYYNLKIGKAMNCVFVG